MAQPFDMKRFHHGCGESLRTNLPGNVRLNRPMTVAYPEKPSQVAAWLRLLEMDRWVERCSK